MSNQKEENKKLAELLNEKQALAWQLRQAEKDLKKAQGK